MIGVILGLVLYIAACFGFYKAGWHGGKAAAYQEWIDWERETPQ